MQWRWYYCCVRLETFDWLDSVNVFAIPVLRVRISPVLTSLSGIGHQGCCYRFCRTWLTRYANKTFALGSVRSRGGYEGVRGLTMPEV